MSGQLLLDVFVRWLHIGGAIVLVGGAVFSRFVLMPAAEALPSGEHDSLKQRILQRWKLFVHPLVAIVLLSGLYNLMMKVKIATPTWHMLFGIKFLIAIVVLFVASVLVGRSSTFQPMRANSRMWLTINIALAAIVVLISNFLRYLPTK
jgi:uncharacterized membrane protein